MKNIKGFTLLELIISMAIFCVVAVAFLSMFAMGQMVISRSGHRSQNTYSIQQTAEQIMSTGSIAAFSATNPSATATPSNIQIVFPSVTTLVIPGDTVTIHYSNVNIPDQMVIYLPN